MNDYVRGVLEALTWIQLLLEKNTKKETPEILNNLKKEVDETLSDVKQGMAIDFRERLRAYG